MTSSGASDANSATLQERIDSDAKQKILDDAARKSEQEDSAKAYARLSLRAETLQSCFDALSSKLTDFSGSEEEKQKRALSALADIQAGAKKLERENRALKVGLAVAGAVAVGLGIYSAVK
ncbi:MAG: hypothetical protein IMZ69_02405 [Spirochaetes bacterium]|nr:hypothetical protein [Spirochaetota bacterium]